MNMIENYRYPGSSPFQDTDYDRRLFFGRDQEKASLLHLVLSEKVVVLFAKSGMGKTSLLNAGVLQTLRERDFLPLMIRLNDPQLNPIQAVYREIRQHVTQRGIESAAGDESSLWSYFKTVEFWSAEDVLLTPILILDQFEEFFTLHPANMRKAFITQFADLVWGRSPKDLLGSLKQGEEGLDPETPPNVKIIISMREDFLGQLEEMTREIPEILDNRFRLLPLHRDQAQQAIIEPAVQAQDAVLQSQAFRYAPETVETMLDFLCKRKEHAEMVRIDEVEPFQLQLLCQHIEATIPQKQGQAADEIIVQPGDLGGTSGMQQVLENFYDHRLQDFGARTRNKVRTLFEKGLISSTDRRLSLEEEYITRQFHVPKDLLVSLVESRLLRAEPRVGSIYYELSHDTLVEPIRRSQRRQHAKSTRLAWIGITLSVSGLVLGGWFVSATLNNIYSRPERLRYQGKYQEAIGEYQRIIAGESLLVQGYKWYRAIFQDERQDEIMKAEIEETYLQWGWVATLQQDPEEAIRAYQTALEQGIRNVEVYKELGGLYQGQGNLEEAVKLYREALEHNPENAPLHCQLGKSLVAQAEATIESGQQQPTNRASEQSASPLNLGSIYGKQEKLNEAIQHYKRSLELDPKYADAYKELALIYISQNEGEQALNLYRLAIKQSSELASIYTDIADALSGKNLNDQLAQLYTIAAQQVELPDAEYYINLGWKYHDLGKYAEASALYRKAIARDETSAKAYASLGNVLRMQDQYDEAISTLRQAITLSSDYTFAYALLGESLRMKGDYAEAIKNLQKAIELKSDYAFAYASLGETYRQQGNYAEAIANLEKAIELEPNYAWAYNNLGLAFASQGNDDKAIESYQQVIALDPQYIYAYRNWGDVLNKQGKYDEAVAQYQAALKIDPNDVATVNGLGVIFENQRTYDKAIEFYQQAIALNPQYKYAYRNWGDVLNKQGKYEEAIAQYQAALKIDPNDVATVNGLGVIFENQGNYDNAIEFYQQAIALDPQYMYAYKNWGGVLNKQGKYEEAIVRYQEALKIDPNDVDTYYGLGVIFANQGKYPDAVAQYRQALAINPKFAFAYAGIGNVLIQQGKYAEATEQYNQALALDPKNLDVLVRLGDILRWDGKNDQSLEYYRQALELDPKYVPAYNGLGSALSSLGRYAEAMAQYQKVLEIAPKFPDAYVGIGSLYFDQGNYAKAISYYEKGLEIDPSWIILYSAICGCYQEMFEYQKAYDLCKIAYDRNPEQIDIQTNFTYASLLVERYDTALQVAKQVLANPGIAADYVLSLRFIVIAVLLVQDQRAEAIAEVQAFLDYHASLAKDYRVPPSWKYNGAKQYIKQLDTLSDADKTLLVTLIEILESARPEADKKLKEL